jgi:hypothetical protein
MVIWTVLCLNNSFRPIESFDFSKNLRAVVDDWVAHVCIVMMAAILLNVTKEAGIYSSDIGFGLRGFGG